MNNSGFHLEERVRDLENDRLSWKMYLASLLTFLAFMALFFATVERAFVAEAVACRLAKDSPIADSISTVCGQ